MLNNAIWLYLIAKKLEGPDFGWLKRVNAVNIPVIAEGRINEPAELKKMLELGAFAVVVEWRIFRPLQIAKLIHGELVNNG